MIMFICRLQNLGKDPPVAVVLLMRPRMAGDSTSLRGLTCSALGGGDTGSRVVGNVVGSQYCAVCDDLRHLYDLHDAFKQAIKCFLYFTVVEGWCGVGVWRTKMLF